MRKKLQLRAGLVVVAMIAAAVVPFPAGAAQRDGDCTPATELGEAATVYLNRSGQPAPVVLRVERDQEGEKPATVSWHGHSLNVPLDGTRTISLTIENDGELSVDPGDGMVRYFLCL